MRFQFGEDEFDTGRQELWREGEPLHVAPKTMQLLGVLIEMRPNVVSSKERHDRLWPDVIVDEANLRSVVANLRNALDDHARNGRFLRNVHGRGYAFCDAVVERRSDDGTSSRLVILFHGGRRIVLPAGTSILGREQDSSAVIDNAEVSRHHARVVIERERVTVEDLESKNGAFVRGERIEGPAELSDGDELRLGTVALTVRILLRAQETKTAASS
ncbi:MAG: FHA domain-containing protein [Thermoanaerobaculia bacterium]|jgi:DNA-binding winged helix-turn-helix (wHTH) protein